MRKNTIHRRELVSYMIAKSIKLEHLINSVGWQTPMAQIHCHTSRIEMQTCFRFYAVGCLHLARQINRDWLKQLIHSNKDIIYVSPMRSFRIASYAKIPIHKFSMKVGWTFVPPRGHLMHIQLYIPQFFLDTLQELLLKKKINK